MATRPPSGDYGNVMFGAANALLTLAAKSSNPADKQMGLKEADKLLTEIWKRSSKDSKTPSATGTNLSDDRLNVETVTEKLKLIADLLRPSKEEGESAKPVPVTQEQKKTPSIAGKADTSTLKEVATLNVAEVVKNVPGATTKQVSALAYSLLEEQKRISQIADKTKAVPEALKSTRVEMHGWDFGKILDHLLKEGFFDGYRVGNRQHQIFIHFFPDQPDPPMSTSPGDGWECPWIRRDVK